MRIEASKVENIDGEFDSVEQFRRLHPNFTIDAIDDREVVSMCEMCAEPIFEGDDYKSYEEGPNVHERCADPDIDEVE